MGLLARITSALRGKAGVDYTHGWHALSGTIAWDDSSDIWRTFNAQELERASRINATVYSCVQKIGMTVREGALEVGTETDDGWEPIADHPLTSLLETPNDYMTGGDLKHQCIAHLLLTGYSYLWELRNNGRQLAELWPLPTSWVQREVNSAGRLTGYSVWSGTGKERLVVPPDDMVVMYLPDPSNPKQGLGPMQAAARDYQIDDERRNYLIEMLTNLQVPGLVLKQSSGWSPDQKEEFRSILADTVGKGHRGGPLFLEGGAESNVSAIAPLADLDWPGLTNLVEANICSTFGVPPILIGARVGLEHATYSNYEMAERSFYRGTMVPLWNAVDASLTRGLLWDEGEPRDVLIRHNLSDLWQLKDDQDELVARAKELLLASIASRNEVRRIVGLDPIDGPKGDVLMVPMGMMEVPIDGHVLPPASVQTPAPVTDWEAPSEEEAKTWLR